MKGLSMVTLFKKIQNNSRKRNKHFSQERNTQKNQIKVSGFLIFFCDGCFLDTHKQ